MELLNVRTMKRSKGVQPSDPMPQPAQSQREPQDQGYNMRQDSEFLVPENVILQTTNYGMFKLDRLNRAVRQDKLDRLYDAVTTKNLLHLFPIVVSREMVVIDGQHRLGVAEALQVPIYYIVSNQMRIEDAAFVNKNTDVWRKEDYLHHWCQLGLPEYLRLREFWQSHSWLTLSTTVSLCYHGDVVRSGNGHTRIFESGEYVVNNLEGAERVCAMAMNFKSYVSFWKDTPFLHALRNLDSNVDYDHERMMQKIKYLSSRLVRCATADDYIKVLNTIYNFKVPDDKKVLLTKVNRGSKKFRAQ